VALAFAREGADVLISYLSEEADAQETARVVEAAGRRCVAVAGDISEEAHCRAIVDRAVEEFGKIDILVNNAAFQMTREDISEISTEEFDRTLKTNLYAMFWLTRAAVPHMPAGGSVINTSSIQADNPSPQLLPYAMTKAGIQNFTGGLAQMLGKKGIRANCVAPGPDLDAAHPGHDAAGEGEDLRQGRGPRAGRAAGRARPRLRPAGVGRLQLHGRGDGRGDRRQASHLMAVMPHDRTIGGGPFPRKNEPECGRATAWRPASRRRSRRRRTGGSISSRSRASSRPPP
jgi:NAD(P)-dependent dehydrogenase (short-subunit alcohol dehydrogenase family)